MPDLVGVVCVGKSSTGKTRLSKGILRRYLAGPRRVVVLDPKDGLDSFEPVAGLAQFQVIGGDWSPGSVRWDRLIADKRRVRIACAGLAPDEADALGDELAAACYEVGDVLFLCDEAHEFFSPQHDKHGAMVRLWTGGRHRGVDLLFVTQMPVRLNIIARKQASHAIVTALREGNDAQAGADLAQVEVGRVVALPKYRALVADLFGGVVFEVSTAALDGD